MNLKEAFTEELWNLHIRKKSVISIKETPNEETITIDELPDQYKDILALVPDTKDDKEETIEGDLLIAYLQGVVLLHFFTGSFFVLFIQSAIFTQILRSYN